MSAEDPPPCPNTAAAPDCPGVCWICAPLFQPEFEEMSE